MKYLYLLLPFALLGCATPGRLSPEQAKMVEVVEVSKPKNDIYELSLQWMARTFNSAKDVIQYQNKDEGMIIGKGCMVVKGGLGMSVDIYFTMTIESKENKYRVTYDNLGFVVPGGDSRPASLNDFLMSRFRKKASEYLVDLKSSISSQKNTSW